MSSHSQTDDLVDRVVQAQEELKRLKHTQIIGGEGMGYYEYYLDGGSYSLPNRRYWGFFIFFIAESDFPLISVEYDIYENGTKVTGTWGTSPVPYGGVRNSLCAYDTFEKETLGPSMWEDEVSYNVNGRIVSTNDTNVGIFMTTFNNTRSSDAVNVSFRNIKIRSTIPGVAVCRFGDPYAGG